MTGAATRTTRVRRPVALVVTGVVLLAVAAAVLSAALPVLRTTGAGEERPVATAEHPFAGSSPFNTPIAPDAPVDPRSAEILGPLVGDGQVFANMHAYGIPVWRADTGGPGVPVACDPPDDWGTCPFDGLAVPVPAGARPHSGSDGAMVVVDERAGLVYEFWQARRTADGWTTSWGAVTELGGTGWGGGGTGSGASRLGGLARIEEIRAGHIGHALVLQTNNACRDVFRAPATKTDGRSGRDDCLPEGARVRLPAGIDLDAQPGLTPAERAVAEALQVYGAYVVDLGAAPLSVSFELAPDSSPADPGRVYREAGLPWDYFDLPAIPWDRLELLAEP